MADRKPYDGMFLGQGLLAPSKARAGLLAGPMSPEYSPFSMPPDVLAQMIRSQLGAPVNMTAPGNIDIFNRPQVPMPGGGVATVRSMSFRNNKGEEVLIPTVSPDGRLLTDQEAKELYGRTGKHLGKFPNPFAATYYAEALHRQQEDYYTKRRKP